MSVLRLLGEGELPDLPAKPGNILTEVREPVRKPSNFLPAHTSGDGLGRAHPGHVQSWFPSTHLPPEETTTTPAFRSCQARESAGTNGQLLEAERRASREAKMVAELNAKKLEAEQRLAQAMKAEADKAHSQADSERTAKASPPVPTKQHTHTHTHQKAHVLDVGHGHCLLPVGMA